MHDYYFKLAFQVSVATGLFCQALMQLNIISSQISCDHHVSASASIHAALFCLRFNVNGDTRRAPQRA